MHFFIEHANIINQGIDDAFGPDQLKPEAIFNITSQLQLSAKSKAFACQPGLMMVQQSVADAALVNIVLKPTNSHDIIFSPVVYYIYRGILKESLMSGANIKPAADADKCDFLKRYWEEWGKFKTDAGTPSLPDPAPIALGYDNSLVGSLPLENIFNHLASVKPVFVKEGEWMGNFSSTHKAGFEIILGRELPLDIDYVRAAKYVLDVSALTGPELKIAREKVLSYIDPAAFWGLHFYTGLNTSTYTGAVKTIVRKKGVDIYTPLLDKYLTKNSVYLDIRSEKGGSYNFYNNYHDSSGNNIRQGNSTKPLADLPYYFSQWPLMVINETIKTDGALNDITLSLRVDDNTKPLIFFEDPSLAGTGNTSRFFDEFKLMDASSGKEWTKPVTLKFPNNGSGAVRSNVSFYLKLYYFRQEYNASAPDTILKNENYVDNSFCPIDLKNLAVAGYTTPLIKNKDFCYIRGKCPTNSKSFGYVADNGCMWDGTRVVFYAKSLVANKDTGELYKKTIAGSSGGLHISANRQLLSLLTNGTALSGKTVVQNTGSGTEPVRVLDIYGYNGIPAGIESLLLLGITKAEFDALQMLGGLSNIHHRYVYIAEDAGSPFTDINGSVFRKYKLGVQGLSTSGDQAMVQWPATDMFVYAHQGYCLASKAFAAGEVFSNTYIRNYEEGIGYDNTHATSGKRYEDYFIDLDPLIRAVVTNFKTALAGVTTGGTAISQIRAIVADKGKALFAQAVSTVQASLALAAPRPDDRPLYWARMQMAVALKRHSLFATDINSAGEIIKGSDLEKMVKLFEENSRNYTGLNFTSVPSLYKKIIITGFDPFQLNPIDILYGAGPETSNPSGFTALALHDSIVTQGIFSGYIQVVIFPVRYFDFDDKVVENVVMPFLKDNSINMIMTLSLNGGSYYFDLERFACKFRGGRSDNLNINGNSFGFRQIQKTELGDEFYETTLPTSNIITAVVANGYNLSIQRFFYDQSYETKDHGNRKHVTDNHSEPNGNTNLFPKSEIKGILLNGSGSNYLSNEIFYRVARLRENPDDASTFSRRPSTVKTGHFHLADASKKNIPEGSSIVPFTQTQIVEETKNAIIRSLPNI